MKTKLLKKLRKKGRNEITIYSVTTTNGTVTGMKIGYNDDIYSGLFFYGDTKEDVYCRAERIYLRDNIESIRKRYKRYSINAKS